MNFKLYVDESGNTGGAAGKESNFNFADQPYYVLAGLLIREDLEGGLTQFAEQLKIKYKITGELKAERIYSSKINLIIDLITCLNEQNVPYFIELMDKKFYLSTQIVTHVLARPVNASDKFLKLMNFAACKLTDTLTDDVFIAFANACKSYSKSAFEDFIDLLHHCLWGDPELVSLVEITKKEYENDRAFDPENAYKKFLPSPDEDQKGKKIHLLPNYHALSNLLGRLQKYRLLRNLGPITIVHDEQVHFESIYKNIVDDMKSQDTDSQLSNSEMILSKASYNLDDNIALSFASSDKGMLIQVTDVIAGFVMRTWRDFIKEDYDRLHPVIPSLGKLLGDSKVIPLGTNFVVHDREHHKYVFLINSYQT